MNIIRIFFFFILFFATFVWSVPVSTLISKLTGNGGWKNMPEGDRRGHLATQRTQLASRKQAFKQSENKAAQASAEGRKEEAMKHKSKALEREKSIGRLTNNVSALEANKSRKMKESSGNKLHFAPNKP